MAAPGFDDPAFLADPDETRQALAAEAAARRAAEAEVAALRARLNEQV
ncbi:MAG: hypothetical protein OXG55_15665 [bacterium]|nr:hypothetical protein [bacterium]MCY3951028.1 hypothetical protein [bacterium]MCY4104672.1 hypothetical protein [bacterium]